MDQIRYEEESVERELKKEQEEYSSILQQLELTDYEQIRQRLDECMDWLKKISRASSVLCGGKDAE